MYAEAVERDVRAGQRDPHTMLRFGLWSARILVALGSAQALVAADRVTEFRFLTDLASEDRAEMSAAVEAWSSKNSRGLASTSGDALHTPVQELRRRLDNSTEKPRFRHAEAEFEAARRLFINQLLIEHVAQIKGQVNAEGRRASAQAVYEGFQRAGAAMDSIFTRIYDDLGSYEPAWRQSYTALRTLARTNQSRQVRALLIRAILSFRQTKDLNLAIRRSYASLLRIAAHAELDGREEAFFDVDVARVMSSYQLSESLEQQRSVAIDNLLAQSQLMRNLGDASYALTLLNVADLRSRQESNHHRLIEILQKRAEIWLSLGQEREAESDQEAGLMELEWQRRTLGDDALRVILADVGRPLLEERIALQLQRGESAGEILDTAERLRARALLDATGKPGAAGWPEPRPSRDIAAALPDGTAIIEYLWVRGNLLAWVITHNSIDLVDLGFGRHQIEASASRFDDALKNNRDSDADARELYRLLIASVEPHLGGISTLVFSPDEAIYHVSFAALREGSSGRFLIEKYAVAVAPSAEIYTVLAERYRERSQFPPSSILLLGEPKVDQSLFATLTSLPAAAREVEALRSEYSQPLVLTGPEATAERFLDALPDEDILHYAGHTVGSKGEDAPSLLLTPSAATESTGGLLPPAGISFPHPPLTRVAVLAGCRTAEGRLSQNEGTLGLAHAFLAAGIPVVLASDWSTNDESSSHLLLSFHAWLREGADPLMALRQAQLDLLRSPDRNLAAPHTWAAFQAIGGAFVSQ